MAVARDTHQALAGISAARAEALQRALESPRSERRDADLDARASALAKVAALIALDAPPAAYARQVANAVDAGVTAEDLLGVLRAVAPEVGEPRMIAAAPEIMLALGLSLPNGAE